MKTCNLKFLFFYNKKNFFSIKNLISLGINFINSIDNNESIINFKIFMNSIELNDYKL